MCLDCSWMVRTRSELPRGITRSMCFSIESKSLTSSRVDTREIALAAPYLFNASFTSSIRYLLLLAASLPPFSSNPFALDIASAATCGKLSGRDSKITNSTPIGTVICCSSRPSANLVRRSTRPTLFSESFAICRSPELRDFSLAVVRERRESSALARLALLAASKSSAFAARISDCLDSSRSARLLMHSARSSGRNACSTLLPTRAEISYLRLLIRFFQRNSDAANAVWSNNVNRYLIRFASC